MDLSRPLPALDPDTRGHFEAAARGEVAVCVCAHCGAVLHLPRPGCHHCGSDEVRWRTVAPTARLWSFTTVHQRFHPAFEPPYTVVVVALDELPDVHLTGQLPGEPDLVIGMPMRARFEPAGEVALVQWEPVA